MDKKLPTDPLSDASTGVVRRSRGAFLKRNTAAAPAVDRRNPARASRYAGPERRHSEPPAEPRRLFGLSRWAIVAGSVYLAALALIVLLIFTW
jgi:hypothetical protein